MGWSKLQEPSQLKNSKEKKKILLTSSNSFVEVAQTCKDCEVFHKI
jgi:hypothetical protein